MIKTATVLLVIAIAALAASAARADHLEARITAHFYTPEQIKKYADLLGLTAEQTDKLRGAYEGTQQKVEQLKQQQQAEVEKFVGLCSPQRVDEQALAAQGEKLMDAERDIRRAQLALLVTIKNSLTPGQQGILDSVKALDPKLREAREAAERWKADGRDLSRFQDARTEFESLLAAGKVKEAESLLDRTLKSLNEAK